MQLEAYHINNVDGIDRQQGEPNSNNDWTPCVWQEQ
jgi:hypothetical protein